MNLIQDEYEDIWTKAQTESHLEKEGFKTGPYCFAIGQFIQMCREKDMQIEFLKKELEETKRLWAAAVEPYRPDYTARNSEEFDG